MKVCVHYFWNQNTVWDQNIVTHTATMSINKARQGFAFHFHLLHRDFSLSQLILNKGFKTFTVHKHGYFFSIKIRKISSFNELYVVAAT